MTAVGEQILTERTLAVTELPSTPDDFESETPNVEPQAWKNMKLRSRKTRDLMKGVEAIRAGRTLYLPMLPAESVDHYNARSTIAALFNGYKATVNAAVGLILQTPPVLGPAMPESLKAMAENVDGKGTHIDVFARKLTAAGINDGLAGIITEYQRADDPKLDRSKASFAATVAMETGEPLDAADEEAMGLRPYFILVKSDNVLFPVYETVNGKTTLVMIVFLFNKKKRTKRFGQQNVKTWRIYSIEERRIIYELWEEVDGKPELKEGPTPMRNVKGIPWSPMPIGEEVAENEYMPAMYDLAELNITHHRMASGSLSLIEEAYVPTMVRIGAEPNSEGKYPTVTVGPQGTIEAPAVQGLTGQPIYYLSPPVDVLDPGEKSLERIKAEMGAMGMSFLAPDPRAAETATANRRDNAAEMATISSVSRALQDCLESAFAFAGQFINQKADGVSVNRDFENLTMDSALMSAYTALAEAGFPKKYIVIALQNGGRISPDADPDAIVAEWDAKAATMEAERAIGQQIALAGTLPDEVSPKKSTSAGTEQ